MSNAFVSIVIPAYNYGRFVCDAVDSALSQTCGDIEVVVVDDGSSDDTPVRLEPYRHRVCYIRQVNKGLSAARNTGIRNARGKWIGFLDADDRWHPRLIQTFLEAVGNDESIGVVGAPLTPGMPDSLPVSPTTRNLGVRDFLISTPITGSSTLVRRDCFDGAGFFDETLTSVEDRDMWLRLAARYRVLQVDSPCWTYRRHNGQMSRNANRMFDNYRRVLQKFFRAHPEHRDLYHLSMSKMYLDASWTYFEQGQRGWALVKLACSSWHRPFRRVGDTPRSRLLRTKQAIRVLFVG